MNDKFPYPFRKGKVRDIIEVSDGHDDAIVLIASDRVSAFDVVMPTPIPSKGKFLTSISNFWFDFFSDVPNHRMVNSSWVYRALNPHMDIKSIPPERTTYAHKANVLPIEFVVRGYMAGALWNDYHATDKITQYVRVDVMGHNLPPGLMQSEPLPEPIFTPATKSESGHDENITFDESVSICADHLGYSKYAARILMEDLRRLSIDMYNRAAAHALMRGILIADTKFEFGERDGKFLLIDEVLTPDSSRFWSLADYEVGRDQDSFDKQILRNYLKEQGWSYGATDDPPELPNELVSKIQKRYAELLFVITGQGIPLNWIEPQLG